MTDFSFAEGASKRRGIADFLCSVTGVDDPWLARAYFYENLSDLPFAITGGLILLVSGLSALSAGFVAWGIGDGMAYVIRVCLFCIFFLIGGGLCLVLYRLFFCVFQGASSRLRVRLRGFGFAFLFLFFSFFGVISSIPLLVLCLAPKFESLDPDLRLTRGFRSQIEQSASRGLRERGLFFKAWAAAGDPAALQLPEFECLTQIRGLLVKGELVSFESRAHADNCISLLGEFERAAHGNQLSSFEAYRDWRGDWSVDPLRSYYEQLLKNAISDLRLFKKGPPVPGIVSGVQVAFEVWPEFCVLWFLAFGFIYSFPSLAALVMSRLPIFYYRRELWRAYLATRFGIFIDAFRVYDRSGSQQYVDVYTGDKHVLAQYLARLPTGR
jgi:hypothetical protein